ANYQQNRWPRHCCAVLWQTSNNCFSSLFSLSVENGSRRSRRTTPATAPPPPRPPPRPRKNWHVDSRTSCGAYSGTVSRSRSCPRPIQPPPPPPPPRLWMPLPAPLRTPLPP
ncbi:unnamed protein product, partial [Ectocarpus sp. 8 AP-2014]